MPTRPSVVLLVGMLVLTAGCTGLIGSGGDDGSADGSTTTATTPPATTTPTATTTTTPTATTAGTKTTASRSQWNALAGQYEVHADQLEAADSFTSIITSEVTDENGTTTSQVTYSIDQESDQYLLNITADTPQISYERLRYTAGDTTYIRVQSQGGTRYFVDSEPYDESVQPVSVSYARGTGISDHVEYHAFNRSGTTTYRGEEMTRYTASGPNAYRANPPGPVAEIDAFEITALVDDDGVVRRLEFTLEATTRQGGTYSQHATVEFVDVDNTGITEPDWTDTAEEEAEETDE